MAEIIPITLPSEHRMEQAERGTASRSQNVVHFLPRTTDALSRVILPGVERIDTSARALQIMIVTPDAESAVLAADVVAALGGRQGVEVLPVTSANRAARMLSERPAHAVAGPAAELQALVQRSAIKLDDLRTIVLAWLDDEFDNQPAAVAALESIFGELPASAMRLMIARRPTPAVEKFVDSHLRTARRMQGGEPSSPDVPQISPSAPALHYISVSAASRPAALRRLLDELDPPSATIVVRDAGSEADAIQTVRSLGYRRTDDPIRVARYDAIPPSHTVVLYDSPVMPSELASAMATGPVQVVALAAPRDMVPLHELADSLRPLTLDGPGSAARSHDARLRDELTLVLSQRAATRELLALEPLLDRFDGLEIAAAAIRLLEAERTRQPEKPSHGLRLLASDRPQSDRGGPPRAEAKPESHGDARNQRPPARGRDSQPPRKDFRGPPRAGARSDRGERKEWTPRPPRGAPTGSPDRRERNLGRGPRSGGASRDDRGGRPNGPPRHPRPFDR
jgi:ATP-dependent RNA helicase DeaD